MPIKKELDVEADSLEEARKRARSTLTGDEVLLSQEVISDAGTVTVTGVGATIEAAFEDAERKVPHNALLLARRELVSPLERTFEITASDEPTAKSLAEKCTGARAKLESVVLKTPGRKGFLGIGRRPNIYTARVLRRAEVEISFRPKAKLHVRIGTVRSLSEIIKSLTQLSEMVCDKWGRVQKFFATGELAALMALAAAFELLKTAVAGEFNILLEEARHLFPDDENTALIEPLELGRPGRAIDRFDKPLMDSQFAAAVDAVDRLVRVLESKKR
jgi:hypothetical protein